MDEARTGRRAARQRAGFGRSFRFTQARKRQFLSFFEPVLKLLYRLYGVVTGDAFADHRLEALSPDGLKILVVRLDTIGDVLLSEPALRALRARFPRSTLHVVTSHAGAAVLEGCQSVDEFYVYQAPWHAVWRGQHVGWRALVDFFSIVRRLRAEHYDLGIELRSDVRDIAFLAACGPRVKVGDSWRGGRWLLDIDAEAPIDAHRVEFALAIVAAVGAPSQPSGPRLSISASDESLAGSALRPLDGKRFIVLHLGAGFASKCLPVDQFARIAGRLGRDHAIVVVGGPDERTLVDELGRLSPVPILDLVGALGLKATAAVIRQADLFVGNDSGPMHIAAAVGRPIVTFFGPSEPHKYRPYGVPHRVVEIDLACRPCDHIHCVHGEFLCMTRIPASEIVRSAEQLLSPAPVA